MGLEGAARLETKSCFCAGLEGAARLEPAMS